MRSPCLVVGLILLFLVPAAAPAQQSAEADPPAETKTEGAGGDAPVTADERLFRRFFQDGANAQDQPWYGLQLVFLDRPGAKAWGFGTTIAVAPVGGLELGGRIDYLDVDLAPSINDRGYGDDRGLTDLELAVKYRFGKGISMGADLTLPTGDEDAGTGTGQTDGSLFGSIRRPWKLDPRFGSGEWTAHLGVGFYDDTRIVGEQRSGRTTLQLGGGFLWGSRPDLVWIVEGVIETKRYDQTGWIGEFVGGLSWRIAENVALRPSLDIGFTSSAPDWILKAEFVFRP
jgi:hypothetical protein